MGLIGEVEGKHAIIIDDMIDTAGTIQIAANALKERGALSVMQHVRIQFFQDLRLSVSKTQQSKN